MNTWRDKVHSEIQKQSWDAYDAANPKDRNGSRPKKHKPYTIPAYAGMLVEMLGRDDEAGCKALMMMATDTPEMRTLTFKV